MELDEKTIVKMDGNTYINDVGARKIYKNDEIYRNYCILCIEDDGTVIFKNNITIGSFNYYDDICESELLKLIKELQNPTTKTVKKSKKNTKEDEKNDNTNKKK